jgi:hypothetical protein
LFENHEQNTVEVGFFGIGKEEIFSGIAGGMRERGEGELSMFLKVNLLCVLGLNTVTKFFMSYQVLLCRLLSVFSLLSTLEYLKIFNNVCRGDKELHSLRPDQKSRLVGGGGGGGDY